MSGKKFHFFELARACCFYTCGEVVFSYKKGQTMRHLRIKPTETDTIMHVIQQCLLRSNLTQLSNTLLRDKTYRLFTCHRNRKESPEGRKSRQPNRRSGSRHTPNQRTLSSCCSEHTLQRCPRPATICCCFQLLAQVWRAAHTPAHRDTDTLQKTDSPPSRA